MPRNEFLCTTKTFGDFELKVKFKLLGDKDKANAGVQFRTKRIPKHHEVSGYQADIGQDYWGALRRVAPQQGARRPRAEELIEKIVKLDDWNDYMIRSEGPRIRLWLNGTLTVDYTEKDDKIERDGHHRPASPRRRQDEGAVQGHHDRGAEARRRKVADRQILSGAGNDPLRSPCRASGTLPARRQNASAIAFDFRNSSGGVAPVEADHPAPSASVTGQKLLELGRANTSAETSLR